MKIVTITLNPAFDVHCFAENFKPYHESVAEITSIEAGGKGVNVSRALKENGVDSVAVLLLGSENGGEFLKSLEKDGLTVAPVWTKGRIRENITLHERENPETRISFHGFSCNKRVLDDITAAVGKIDENSIVAFTGSLPRGISVSDVSALLKDFKGQGAKLVIDSRSFTLKEIVALKPWLVKPNKDEAEQATGIKIGSILDAANAAKKLYNQGVENAAVSLGGDGAVLAFESGVFYAKTPKINALSTIGAGDSFVAGFISGAAQGETVEKALKRAAAYGTAACLRDGTLPPTKKDVLETESRIIIERIL